MLANSAMEGIKSRSHSPLPMTTEPAVASRTTSEKIVTMIRNVTAASEKRLLP